MLNTFGEICLNLVFSIVVVKSIIWCLYCDFDESMNLVFLIIGHCTVILQSNKTVKSFTILEII